MLEQRWVLPILTVSSIPGHTEAEFPLVPTYIESFIHAVPPEDADCLSTASAPVLIYQCPFCNRINSLIASLANMGIQPVCHVGERPKPSLPKPLLASAHGAALMARDRPCHYAG